MQKIHLAGWGLHLNVLMEYKGLENSIKVEEQSLETPRRKGFVAVEWGGTEIK